MSGVVDLHIHTTFSDGLYTPRTIVDMALEQGLRYIAISDHDTIDGIGEAIAASRGTPLTVIPGVEMSTCLGEQELHVLGYLLDHTHPELLATLEWLEDSRKRRAKTIVEKLRELGVCLSWERVLAIGGHGTIGRPHIARAMEEAEYVASSQEAFDRYLGRGRPAYVPRVKVSPFEAIRLITEGGGLPVLAHPWDQIAVVPDLAAKGLRGLEVYYPGYSVEATAVLCAQASRHDLFCTGGSDFHGYALLADNRLGTPDVPLSCVQHLLTHRRGAQERAKNGADALRICASRRPVPRI